MKADLEIVRTSEKNRLFQGFVIMISPDYHALLDKIEENFYLQTADSVAPPRFNLSQIARNLS